MGASIKWYLPISRMSPNKSYLNSAFGIFLSKSKNLDSPFKRRFMEFQMYHNPANLFSKLSESFFYRERSKFQ